MRSGRGALALTALIVGCGSGAASTADTDGGSDSRPLDASSHEQGPAAETALVPCTADPTGTLCRYECGDDQDCGPGEACVREGGGEFVVYRCACAASEELCNGHDDDCDGEVDELLAGCCTEGETRSCEPAPGDCGPALETCSGGAFGSCVAERAATTELCDGSDNDCDPSTPDGAADPALGASCDGADLDACAEGELVCAGGVLVCAEGGAGRAEQCNDLDDDCDGVVDEGCIPSGFQIVDFDVDDAGRLVIAGTVQGEPQLYCYDAQGLPVHGPIPLAVPDASGLSFVSLDVGRADHASNVAVTLAYFNFPSTPQDWRNYVTFFDADCERVVGPSPLDSDLPNTGVNRSASLSMTDDGASYLINAHQTEHRVRVLGFDPSGARIAAATMVTDVECDSGNTARTLALNERTGDFTVVCAFNGERVLRRFSADGTALDPGPVTIPGSRISGFAFSNFGAARNDDGRLLYVGAVDPSHFVTRLYEPDGTLSASATLDGSTASMYHARSTSDGGFLFGLPGGARLFSPNGEVVVSYARALAQFELDAENHVFARDGAGRVGVLGDVVIP